MRRAPRAPVATGVDFIAGNELNAIADGKYGFSIIDRGGNGNGKERSNGKETSKDLHDEEKAKRY